MSLPEDPPINRLSPEVLVQIFQHVLLLEDRSLSDWDKSYDEVILKRALAPYSVSSVCRYWDEVSTLAPELWGHSRIIVSLGVGNPAQMTRRCLERAPPDKLLALHISCWRTEEEEGVIENQLMLGGESSKVGRVSERQGLISTLPIISACIHRISRMNLVTKFATSLPPFSLICTSPTPLALGTLQVTTHESRATEDASLPAWPPALSMSGLPQLQIMDLSGATFMSYCRNFNALVQPFEGDPKRSLKIRNLSSTTSENFALEELIEFLERIALKPPRRLRLVNV
jgi:hypothetical protein